MSWVPCPRHRPPPPPPATVGSSSPSGVGRGRLRHCLGQARQEDCTKPQLPQEQTGKVSGNEVALYLLIAVSLTLGLVPEFAGGEREGERRGYCYALQQREPFRVGEAGRLRGLFLLGWEAARHGAVSSQRCHGVWSGPRQVTQRGLKKDQRSLSGPAASTLTGRSHRRENPGRAQSGRFIHSYSLLFPSTSVYLGSPSLQIIKLLSEYTGVGWS